MSKRQDFEALQSKVEALTRELAELKPALNEAGKEAAQEKLNKDVLSRFGKFKKALLDAKKQYHGMYQGMDEVSELADLKKSIEASDLEDFDRAFLLNANTRSGHFIKAVSELVRMKGRDGNWLTD